MRCTRRVVGGLLLIGLLLVPRWSAAQTWSSGSTGADGPFNPAGNTTLALPATGVFNFTTINIPSGVTVTFARNGGNTPAILLATGTVTINGAIDVSGSSAPAWGRPGQGGPGGFDGGAGGDGLTTSVGGSGLGPGGGGGASGSAGSGGGGGYAAGGASGATTYFVGGPGGGTYACCSNCTPGGGGSSYGSSFLRPIIGGSGGGGSSGYLGSGVGAGGGGGGGAILIASSASIAVNGGATIRANGGQGASSNGGGGGGSAGAIRLIAPTITGTGYLYAQAGYGGGYCGGKGSDGRIRLEATTLSFTGSTTPLAVTSLLQPVYPGTGQPALAIASIGGVPAPASPLGSFLTTPDVQLPTGSQNPVAVVLTAGNVPLGTTVQVVATPQNGARSTATCSLLDGTQASSTCTTSITISLTQTNVLTASAIFPLVASAGEGPIYAGGEEVKWVKVANTLGGASTVTYITATGKEIPATAIANRMQ